MDTQAQSTGRVVVSGANGFVGKALCETLAKSGLDVRALLRENAEVPPEHRNCTVEYVGDISERRDWTRLLSQTDTVVHLVGRAHVLRETAKDSLAEFRRVNAMGARLIAQGAAEAGARRIVYLSSIGVHGRSTRYGAFTEEDEISPHNEYALSKYEGEETVREVASETGLESVVLRSPLAYGPGVKANFLRLLKMVDSPLPKPLGSVKNQRSFIYVGNLADAILTCIQHPEAAGTTYLVNDGRDFSTPELISDLADELDKPSRLVPTPPRLLRLAARAVRKPTAVEPLLDSLVVDATKIRGELSWKPPYTPEHGLAETAQWFKDHRVHG